MCRLERSTAPWANTGRASASGRSLQHPARALVRHEPEGGGGGGGQFGAGPGGHDRLLPSLGTAGQWPLISNWAGRNAPLDRRECRARRKARNTRTAGKRHPGAGSRANCRRSKRVSGAPRCRSRDVDPAPGVAEAGPAAGRAARLGLSTLRQICPSAGRGMAADSPRERRCRATRRSRPDVGGWECRCRR